MSTSPTQRRALLRALTLGGAAVTANSLPDTWMRPLVDSALLPAHAQATETFVGGVEFSQVVNVGDATESNDPNGINAIAAARRGLLNRVLPQAHAIGVGVDTSVSLRTIDGSPDRVDVRVIAQYAENDIVTFERSNVRAGSFVDIHFIGNVSAFHSCFNDQCRLRVDSIDSTITGVVDVNGNTAPFEASPGPWPARPSIVDCEVPEPTPPQETSPE